MPGEKLPFKVFPLPIGLAESPHPLTSRLQQEGPPRRCVTRSQPICRVIPRDLGGVAAEDVNEVRSGKFEPLNLLRLHPTRERSTYENESTSMIDYIFMQENRFQEENIHRKGLRHYGNDLLPFTQPL
ncbi:hypothetical protein E4U11_006682 [Claviceps purpurea]|nr:hypothetical protein E4U11_006682 [Claviceps purpurea]